MRENKVNNNEIKYKTPEILMIDVEKSIVEKLVDDGYNISQESFGKVHKLKENIEEKACVLNREMDDIIEKDVIIIDMKQRVTNDILELIEIHNLPEGTYLTTEKNQRYFNLVNFFSICCKHKFGKLRQKDSIFIVFSDKKIEEEYSYINIKKYTKYSERESISNYDCLPFDINVQESEAETKKYNIVAEGIFEEIFKNYKGKINSNVTFYISSEEKSNTADLLTNIYGELIGYIQIFEENGIKNTLIVLPQCTDREILLSNIFENVLPYFYPEMFKDFVKDTWMNKEEYLLPEIKSVIDEKNKLYEEYQIKIEETERKLKEEKEKNQFLYNIISSCGTGKILVDNIIKCLEYLEYFKVEDYDEIRDDGDKEEDLHIYINHRDYMVAEVKGINGPPVEDDCNVIVKYKSRNCAKVGVSSIHGMVFVNYHKNVEPNKREELGFTSKEIKDAKRDGYTLIGTYELFKAVKLCKENILDKSIIRKSLETTGVFKCITEEFEVVGKIDNLLKGLNVICVPLDCKELKLQDKLLIMDGMRYYQTKIESMMCEDKFIEIAKRGDKVGIKIKENIPQLKSAQIYLIKEG